MWAAYLRAVIAAAFGVFVAVILGMIVQSYILPEMQSAEFASNQGAQQLIAVLGVFTTPNLVVLVVGGIASFLVGRAIVEGQLG